MDRDLLRRSMRRMRLDMPEAQRADASRACVRRILEMGEYQAARSVMAYVAIKGELDISPVIEAALRDGKALYLPRVEDQRVMRAVRFRGGDGLVKSTFGVPEPVGSECAEAGEIDLILTPGVAFDLSGGRLGYGAGYYDRFLRGADCFRLGVCCEAQIVERIALHGGDVRMHALMTERCRYDVRGG